MFFLVSCNAGAEGSVIGARPVDDQDFFRVFEFGAEVEIPLGIHSREAGAVAFVFRYQDFCQCFGFADALGLGMEVVIVLIEVTAIGVYFVGHGQDIFDARDFEIGNGCADGVDRRGRADVAVDAVAGQGAVEFAHFRCYRDADFITDADVAGFGRIIGRAGVFPFSPGLAFQGIAIVGIALVSHVVDLLRRHARVPVRAPRIGNGNVHGITDGVIEPAHLSSEFQVIRVVLGFCGQGAARRFDEAFFVERSIGFGGIVDDAADRDLAAFAVVSAIGGVQFISWDPRHEDGLHLCWRDGELQVIELPDFQLFAYVEDGCRIVEIEDGIGIIVFITVSPEDAFLLGRG